jgi:hypothetical protein
VATTVKSIVEKLNILLVDATNTRWTLKELVGWLNSAGKAVVEYKPSALTANTTMPLAPGTKQVLPATGLQLIDVIRNMGSDGTSPGRAISVISRSVLDGMFPDWHSSTPAAVVRHFVYDPRDPKTFYVFPPQPNPTSQRVEVVMSVCPSEIAYVDESLSSYASANALGATGFLDDIYESALIDYCLYRAFGKDGEQPVLAERAAVHYRAFASSLGVKLQNEVALAPRTPGAAAAPQVQLQ